MEGQMKDANPDFKLHMGNICANFQTLSEHKHTAHDEHLTLPLLQMNLAPSSRIGWMHAIYLACIHHILLESLSYICIKTMAKC